MLSMDSSRTMTRVTAVASALALAVFAFVGGWQRRWISDDGLIVLRTVRNLLAGNGPVFNAGERVEANTSTLWQYCIYAVALVTDAPLETIALWLALLMTTAAALIATLGTAHLYAHKALVLLPVGGVLYFALPPARDFATSGLEWGLSLLWLAVQWLLLALWAKHAKGTGPLLWLLAFHSGLSWLVRPELALYGGVTGLLLLAATWRNKKQWLPIVAFALPVPAAYQIFRMGYYGLLVPHTAVAKSASGSQWGTGWTYVVDLAEPYALWIAVAIAIIAGVVAVAAMRGGGEAPGARLRSTRAIVTVIMVCATIHTLYVVRVGGDFMHGRMLLLPFFAFLLPVGVVGVRVGQGASAAGTLLPTMATIAAVAWSYTAVVGGHPYQLPEEGEQLTIVDERTFWTLALKRTEAPLYAHEFLTHKNMNNYVETLDYGLSRNDAMILQILLQFDPMVLSWEPAVRTREMTDLHTMPLSLTMINLGMTGMNAPLNVRVLDNMGLANPLAARQPREENGRIGHDKNLPLEWQIADSAVAIEHLPVWVHREYVTEARAALYTEEFQKLFRSYRSPLTLKRFLSNMWFSVTGGRTISFSEDPAEYANKIPVENPLPINWPYEVELDYPRNP